MNILEEPTPFPTNTTGTGATTSPAQTRVSDSNLNFSTSVKQGARYKSTTKAREVASVRGSINESLTRRKKSNTNKSTAKKDSIGVNGGYESSESEGTKALNEQYEREPHEFLVIGSDNYQKLPAIDQARVFLLQKSPT